MLIKYSEKTLITEEWLLNHGFEIDQDFDLPDFKYKVFRDIESHQVEVKSIGNNANWSVHVDNDLFETIGSIDTDYVEVMVAFLKMCKFKNHSLLNIKID